MRFNIIDLTGIYERGNSTDVDDATGQAHGRRSKGFNFVLHLTKLRQLKRRRHVGPLWAIGGRFALLCDWGNGVRLRLRPL